MMGPGDKHSNLAAKADPAAADASSSASSEPSAPASISMIGVPELASDADHGDDCLGVQEEARAFARLISSRHTSTPLSIGLFGDWGTGKSFFIEQMQKEIEARGQAFDRIADRLLAKGDDAARKQLYARWHPRIAQITFNAWHFAEPNLWASLVTRVFDELAALINPAESIEDTRARLLAEVSEGKQRRDQAKLELTKAESLLAEARVERQEREDELEKLREELAVVQAVEAVSPSAPAPVGPDGAPAAAAAPTLRVKGPLAALRVTLRWIWSQGKWTRIGIIVGLVLLVLGGLLLLAHSQGWIDLMPSVALATAGAGAVTGVCSTAGAWWLLIQPKILAVQAAMLSAKQTQASVSGFVASAARDLLRPGENALTLARRRVEEAEAGRGSANAAIEQANEQVSRARRMLQELEGGRRFYAFITDRDQSEDYRQHLGLVSMIREDFAKLEEILEQVEREGSPDEEGPQPISRIVLYIDDLDRCAPERVVEVLQAVHLLLATPIFVVVVAVDVRWLRRSLTLYYDRLLETRTHEGGELDEARPTPKNYLEKIFQIPFSLRPMQADGFAALVKGILEPSQEGGLSRPHPADVDGATVTPADSMQAKAWSEQEAELDSDVVLTLAADEIEFISSLHAVIDTPRLAKALVNTYRLLRAEITPEELREYLAHKTYQTVLTLLAIQVGRAAEAAALFRALSRTKARTLGQLVTERHADAGNTAEERANWQELLDAIKDAGLSELPLSSVHHWTARVRRFSFNPWPTASR